MHSSLETDKLFILINYWWFYNNLEMVYNDDYRKNTSHMCFALVFSHLIQTDWSHHIMKWTNRPLQKYFHNSTCKITIKFALQLVKLWQAIYQLRCICNETMAGVVKHVKGERDKKYSRYQSHSPSFNSSNSIN